MCVYEIWMFFFFLQKEWWITLYMPIKKEKDSKSNRNYHCIIKGATELSSEILIRYLSTRVVPNLTCPSKDKQMIMTKVIGELSDI